MSFEKKSSNVYTVNTDASLEAAYEDWVDNQYDGEPADVEADFPEIPGTVDVQFTRDIGMCEDTVEIIG